MIMMLLSITAGGGLIQTQSSKILWWEIREEIYQKRSDY
jgi:hypothetical protein